MGFETKLARMPAWPRRMPAEVAAMYVGLSMSGFLDAVKRGAMPAGVRDGGKVYWCLRQLDAHVDRQFGLPQLARANGQGDDSWDDAR